MPKQHSENQTVSIHCGDRPCGWQRAAALVLMAFLLNATSLYPALAGPVLRTGTSMTEVIVPPGKFYHPRQSTILYADRLAEDYKLPAAEALYRKALRQNAKNAGALNGLGKIAFYKTTSSNQNLRDQTENLHAEAIKNFMAALRYQPGYAEARVNLASVYMEQGRLGEAADELNKALSLTPNSSNALARKGEWLVRSRQYNEAIPYLKRAIRLNSANVTAQYYLGVAESERNQQDQALQKLNTTLALQPNNGNAHYRMGLIYDKQGNGAAAVEHYLKAVSLKPELHPARIKLVDYYEHRGDWSAALEQLKNLIDSSDPQWELIERVGRLSIKNNQPEVAVLYYRKWQKLHPEDAIRTHAAISKAKAQVAGKRLRDDNLISQGEAHRYAEQAIQYEPNNIEARMIKAKLDRAIGDKSPLLKGKDAGVIDAALSQPAYQPYQNLEKGDLLLARFQFREAREAYRSARRAGEGKRTQMNFGELFLAKGLPSLAEESFQQVLALLPDNASAKLGLAQAREAREQSDIWVREARLNQKKNALQVANLLLERALRANIENPAAHYELARTYEKADDYASAADHYYACLQLDPHADNADSLKRKIALMKHKALEQKSTGSGTGL